MGFSDKGSLRTLGFTTFAFFVSFMVWFNMAPFASTIKDAFGLSLQQIKILAVINVSLTIPARIVIGMLVDRFGPRRVYSTLLAVFSIPCFTFALADTFTQLLISRLFLGVIGAGFVIGIRMVSDWFPAKTVGTAQGIYGGWGNFGSAASAFILPLFAMYIIGSYDLGWRYAIAATGLLSLFYSVIYYFSVEDTPPGRSFARAKKLGALEVSSKRDVLFLLGMTLPLFLVLALLVWKLKQLTLISAPFDLIAYGVLATIYVINCRKIISVNKGVMNGELLTGSTYKFKQVAILDMAYLVTFGSELAMVSMLPMFFQGTFSLSVAQAGMVASSFAFTNLIARPGGGWLSDKFGRRKMLRILFFGIVTSYCLMSLVSSSWSIFTVLILTMTTSFFGQAASGSVFSIVPLVKKRLTGQVAGMVGAYGNVGAVLFLTILTFVSPAIFFLCIASFALLTLGLTMFLDDPILV
jgi:MFS transporter, NNP family, nitrate/nitrite transporter